jgi:tRNA pseudouridine38-40 synthase
MSESKRIALVLQYVGTHFHGWQRQPQQRTVQEVVENAIASVLKQYVPLIAAGRTDAGVHAAAQVAHFEANSPIPAFKWGAVLNAQLPSDVTILDSQEVPANWHARFSACWRRYRYTIYTEAMPNLFVQPFAWHYYHAALDEFAIQQALLPLVGQHHLAAFQRSGSQRTHAWVNIQKVACHRVGDFIHIDMQANAFLYGMMRLLVGMLVLVGRKQLSVADFQDIWQHERRELVKYAAPAQGLCLLGVGYRDWPFSHRIWNATMPHFLVNPVERENVNFSNSTESQPGTSIRR